MRTIALILAPAMVLAALAAAGAAETVGAVSDQNGGLSVRTGGFQRRGRLRPP